MITRCFDVGIVNEDVVTLVREAVRLLDLNDSRIGLTGYQSSKVFSGTSGRPKYHITREQLEFLIEKRFSSVDIALLLGVSQRTLKGV